MSTDSFKKVYAPSGVCIRLAREHAEMSKDSKEICQPEEDAQQETRKEGQKQASKLA